MDSLDLILSQLKVHSELKDEVIKGFCVGIRAIAGENACTQACLEGEAFENQKVVQEKTGFKIASFHRFETDFLMVFRVS